MIHVAAASQRTLRPKLHAQHRPVASLFTARDAISHQTPASDLLRLCLRSRDEAWHEFVRRFQPAIAAVIVKTLRRCIRPTPVLVDDLVQETYLKLCADQFKALRRFECRHEHALAGFLKVVASNVTQDYLRGILSKKRGSGKAEENVEYAVVDYAVSCSQIERQIAFNEIQSCLERQGLALHLERDRKIFWLYYKQGLTAKAIARLPDIGLSTKGVESALVRLTRLMRESVNHRKNLAIG